jgi:16S rRNA processing protein RimM
MSERIEVGHVVGPHGLAGKVKLSLYNPDSPVWAVGERVFMSKAEAPGVWTELKELSIKGTQGVAQLQGVEGLAAADAARGSTLYAERSDLDQVAPDEVFLADLIGLRLQDATGRDLGRFAEVRVAGNREFFVVDGPFDILLPTQTPFSSVDQAKGVATLGFEFEPEA